jgi:quercetin dioxygenase-like cupin family protein
MSVVDLFASEAVPEDQAEAAPSSKKNGQSYVDQVQVVRANRRKRLTLPGSYVSYDLLTPDLNRQVEVMFMRINPGEHSGEEPMVDLPGEKFGYVLQGQLEAKVGETVYPLAAGDSIYFPAHFPHSWKGLGEDSIEVLWVLTPPRF